MIRDARSAWRRLMSERFIMATFSDADSVVRATRALRKARFRVYDVYTPFPMEELEHQIVGRSSRIPWITLFAGAGGAMGALLLQFYTAVLDWPLNVGGKPANSTLAFVPITFELTVLVAGLATVAALLLRARLFPGKPGRLAAEGVTNDRFALVLRPRAASFDALSVHWILKQHGAVEIQERAAGT